LDGEKIECPDHGGCFNAKSGEALEMPAMDPLRTYRVRVVGDDVEVLLKDDE
jgi:ethylbenzene dioxygenase ferredoxin subunit